MHKMHLWLTHCVKLFRLGLVLSFTHCRYSINIKSVEQSPAMGLMNQASYTHSLAVYNLRMAKIISRINHTKENMLLNLDLSVSASSRNELFIWGLLWLPGPNLSNDSISLQGTKFCVLQDWVYLNPVVIKGRVENFVVNFYIITNLNHYLNVRI